MFNPSLQPELPQELPLQESQSTLLQAELEATDDELQALREQIKKGGMVSIEQQVKLEGLFKKMDSLNAQLDDPAANEPSFTK